GVCSPRIHAAVKHNHHGRAIDFTDRHLPWECPAFINTKVSRFIQAASKPIDDVQPSVGADQFTKSIPIVAIESLDVEIQQLHQFRTSHGLRLDWRRSSLYFRSSPVKRCLDATYRGIDKLCNFLQRVVKYILQQHTGAFHWG